jgi:heptosyltransferase-2
MTLERVRRVLVMSPNWLGDAVMALPAIADLRRAYPDARLIVAARSAVAGVFRLTPMVDDVVVLGWRGQLFRRRALQEDLARLRSVQADIALLLPNAFSAAWMTRRAGLPERWGYATDLRRPLLSRAVATPKRSVHQAEYYQHLVRELGIATGPREPALLVPREASEEARALLVARGWDAVRPLVSIAPGAAYGTAKRWLPGHYARLVTSLVQTEGAQCVLVGSAGDAETTSWIRGLVPDSARAQVIDLAGATTLATLAGVMVASRAFVSNDSGAMHVASAVGVPVAALFGPTREYETAPLPRAGARAEVLIHNVWCRPCMLRECPIDHRCMKGLMPERVFACVSELMSNPESRVPDPESRISSPESRVPDPEPRIPSPEQ